MKYNFNYFYDRFGEEKSIEFESDNDREAVLRLYDKFGICEFGCIREDGYFFTDEDFLNEREIILLGC